MKWSHEFNHPAVAVAGTPSPISLTLRSVLGRSFANTTSIFFFIFRYLSVFLIICPDSSQGSTIAIRDRVDIKLNPIQRRNGNAIIAGKLVHRSTGTGVPHDTIHVSVDNTSATVSTDSTGRFRHSAIIGSGEHVVQLRYTGSALLDPAEIKIESFYFTKQATQLTLALPSEVSDTRDDIQATFTASDGNSPMALTATLHWGATTTPLQKIAEVHSDATGVGSFSIPRALMTSPGSYRAELRYAGSTDFDPAGDTATVVVTTDCTLTLSIDNTVYGTGETLLASGRLADGHGAPVAGATVTFELDASHVADTKTAANGTYRLPLATDKLPAGTSVLQAVFPPHTRWYSTARSAPVTITIDSPRPAFVRATFTTFTVTILLLLAFVGFRTKASNFKKIPTVSPSPSAGPAAVISGVRTSRTSWSSTLRRAAHHEFSGTVRSATNMSAIGDARILIADEAETEIATDSAGWFRTDELVPGAYEVRFTADGYVHERSSIHVPHKGEFRNCYISLMPVREKIFAMYKIAVRPLLPAPSVWGIWTPRMILEYAKKYNHNESLSDLTHFVEDTFFSKRTPSEEQLAVATLKVREVQRQTARNREDSPPGIDQSA